MATASNQVFAPTLLQPNTYTSGLFTLPSTITSVKISANLQLADKLAVGKTLEVHIYISPDGGTTFPTEVGFGWTSYGPGGFTDRNGTNPDPSVSFNPSVYAGQQAKIVMILPQALTVGATVDTVF